MGFLNPLFLLAGLAVAVPLVLHLVHRHESRRLAFPALRYLQRTEKQHAKRIRLRQLLLLLLRVTTVLLIVVAGARGFLRGWGSVHDPTALVVVLDNSMSSGLVQGGRRVLDELKGIAVSTLDAASPEDRVWVIRVGEPWDLVTPGTPAAARARIGATEVSDAAGDLSAAVRRAIAIASDAELDAKEVHILSDLQETAFRDDGMVDGGSDVSVVVYRPDADPPPNRHLTDVLVGGGLPPIANQRTEVAASVGESGARQRDSIWVRLVVDQRVRAAAVGSEGTTVVLPGGPFSQGPLTGHVETDPDSLAADDRRFFAVSVRRAPGLALEGEDAFFLDQAVGSLEQGGRVRRVPLAQAEILVSIAGAGLDRRGSQVPVLVVPSTDPALLPALNRRLAESGIAWRYESPGTGGEAPLLGPGLPTDLGGVRIMMHYRLARADSAVDEADVLAHLPAGDPWMIAGSSPSGPYLVIASPLDDEATTLPVSAAMVPLLEWIVTRSVLPSDGPAGILAGEPLRLHPAATSVRLPDGARVPVDGREALQATSRAGIYQVLAGDTLVARVPVNVDPRESRLARIGPDDLIDRYGPDVTIARDSSAWARAVFTSRQGLEVWRPLLLLALLLLLAESWIAAAGPERRRPSASSGGIFHPQPARRGRGVTRV